MAGWLVKGGHLTGMFFQSGSSLGLAVRLPFGVKDEVKQSSGWLVGRFLSALVRFLSQSLVSASVTMSGQEYKDGQFNKTPRRQEPSIYAISSTWRHSWNIRINRHHHALKLTPGEMLDDHDCAHNQPTHFVVQPHRRLVHPPPDVASQKPRRALRQPRQRNGLKIRWFHAQG